MNTDPDVDCYFLECDPKVNTPYICDNTFYAPGDELHSSIFKKTIDSIRFFDFSKYDYIIRTNLSSLYIFTELKQYLSTCNRNNLYAGVIGDHNSIRFVSGSGMIMTPDVVNILKNIKDTDIDIDGPDDVMIGYLLRKYGIYPSPAPRLEIANRQELIEHKTNGTLFKSHLHYRLKSSSTIEDEMYVRNQIMKLKIHTPILIKFPTRRIELCASTIQKYISMASNIQNIRFIVSIDNDQSEYISFLESIHPSISVFTGEAKGKVAAINRDMPPSSSFDIGLLASDDMIPVVHGYDQIIIDTMKQFYPDTDGVLFFNDGFQENRLNTLVICGSKYYDRFGYIYNPEYKSLYCDNEFTDVAQRLRKQTYIHQVIIRHEHPYNLHLANDMLYQINDSFMDYDKNVYNRRHNTPHISILICTLPMRKIQFEELLNDIETLKSKSFLNIEVLSDDSIDISTGEKRNNLLNRANGIYSAFVDDDDKLTPDYFTVVERAIRNGNFDCIALNGRYYENGIFKGPFYHSLKYTRWFNDDHGYYRPPNHLNPIKTEICKQISYQNITYKEDIDFSTRLFESGLLKTEYTHVVNQYLYYSTPRLEPTVAFSILIPTMNSRRLLFEQVYQEISRQVYELKKYYNIDAEVLYQADDGEMTLGAKRNLLVSRANGKYCCFIDDDDVISPSYLKTFTPMLQDDYDCASFVGMYYYRGDRLSHYDKPFYHSLDVKSWYETDDRYWRSVSPMNMIKTDIVRKVQYKDIRNTEDHEFSIRLMDSRLLKKEFKIPYIPVYHYIDGVKGTRIDWRYNWTDDNQKIELFYKKVNAGDKKIVFSFSFFGKVHLYLHGLVENCNNINKLYPTAWIYIYASRDFDPMILTSAVNTFNNLKIIWIDKSEPTYVQYMCHRFFAIDEDDVDVMFSRDCDSEINARDQYCINHFLNSSKKFQIIRDHIGHRKKICGGMWGIKQGLLELKIRDKFNTYDFSNNTDENFLADCLYDYIKYDCEVFDEFFNFSGESPMKIPVKLPLLYEKYEDFIGNNIVYFMARLETVITYTDNPSLIPCFVDAWSQMYPTIKIIIILISNEIPSHLHSYSKYIHLDPSCINGEYACVKKASEMNPYEGVLITDIRNIQDINIDKYLQSKPRIAVIKLPNKSYITIAHNWKKMLDIDILQKDLSIRNLFNQYDDLKYNLDKKIVFSFSFYGDVKRYMLGLIENCKKINQLYPHAWIYLYVGSDVDHSVLQEISNTHNLKIINTNLTGHINRLYRFFAIDDDDVDVMFSRDVDSDINARDQYCIDEFLKSNKLVQIIRDSESHNIEMLAGMWACKKLPFKIKDKFLCKHHIYTGSPFDDQSFLRTEIYPYIKEYSIVFDEFFKFPGETPLKIPVELPLTDEGTRNHIGRAVHFKMTLGTVLTASDLNPLYLDCIPLFIQAWTTLFPEVDVVIVLIADEIPSHLQQYSKYIRAFRPIKNMHTAFQAQCIRLLYPQYITRHEGVLITDMDMVPMNRDYYERAIADKPDYAFISYRDVLLPNEIPMCYNIAIPPIWKAVFENETLETFYTRVQEYDGIHGGKGWSTDQLILIENFNAYNGAKCVLNDSITKYNRLSRHIFHIEHEYMGLSILKSNIESGQYSDFHILRPYSQYKSLNQYIVNSLTRRPNLTTKLISSRSFAEHCDWIIDPMYPDLKTFNYTEAKSVDWIFINGDYLDTFCNSILDNKKKFVIIIHNTTRSFGLPELRKVLPFANHIYAINTVLYPSIHHPKLTTIPLGFSDSTLDYIKTFNPPFPDSYRDIEIYTQDVKNKSIEEYFSDLCRSKFVLCPEVSATDSHRVYEAILCGATPVVLRNGLSPLYEKLPICIVNSWSDTYTRVNMKKIDFDIHAFLNNVSPAILEACLSKPRIAFVNFATPSYHTDYVKEQKRLIDTVRKFGYNIYTYNSFEHINSPTHTESPYAFKLYAIDRVRDMGHDIVIWVDSISRLLRPIDSWIPKIEAAGVYLATDELRAGNWVNDKTLNYFEMTRDDAMEMYNIHAAVMAFDFRTRNAVTFMEEMFKCEKAGLFKGNWNNDALTESQDLRCKGHRHDQSCAELVSRKLNISHQPRVLTDDRHVDRYFTAWNHM